MKSFEVNFDGLVGPTHNYSGLSEGNLASIENASQASNPREAAMQGLKKMRLLRSLGLKQAVLPPHDRPDVSQLRRLGFGGSDSEVLASAAKSAPFLLNACSSASPMWTANAATFAPSSDAADRRAHFTPANLVAKLHRCIEPETTAAALRAIFRDDRFFTHHAPLTAHESLGDEGAANHTRLAPTHGEPGIQLFVYGRSRRTGETRPTRFPARQSREACEAVARLHRLDPARTVFAQQNPRAIDAGVFHNDVISVGNGAVYFFHELCFAESESTLKEIRAKWSAMTDAPLHLIPVPEKEVSLDDAVKSYLFNSQLVTLENAKMALIAPQESERTLSVKGFLDRLLQTEGPLAQVHYPELRQSMRNGGGPACLRLRVVLTEEEIRACAPGVFVDDKKQVELEAWVTKHYRDRLEPKDLADPQLLQESRAALDALTRLLGLGALYPFQR